MLLAPARDGVADLLERVFALLGRYRELLATSNCLYACPVGSLSLEFERVGPSRTKMIISSTGWATASKDESGLRGEALIA